MKTLPTPLFPHPRALDTWCGFPQGLGFLRCEWVGDMLENPLLWAAGASPGHVGDHRGEVGGAVELHSAQAVVIGLQDAIDATA